MTDSDDIANLFKHFGGQPDQYREIARSNDAKMSRARWPLLTAVEATQASDAPPVQQHLRGAPQPESASPTSLATPPTPSPATLATPPAAPQAPARQEPALRSVEPAAPSGPSAEFIPPRPRAPARFEPRPPADVAMPFGRMVPEAPAAVPAQAAPAPAFLAGSSAASSAAAPAVSAPPAAAVAAPSPLPLMAPPAPAGLPAQSALAAAPATELQTVFARLAQPLPDTPPTPDKNASLLQRLRRL